MKINDQHIGGKETGPAKIELSGDETVCKRHIGEGRKLLGELKNRMVLGGIVSAKDSRDIPSYFYQDDNKYIKITYDLRIEYSSIIGQGQMADVDYIKISVSNFNSQPEFANFGKCRIVGYIVQAFSSGDDYYEIKIVTPSQSIITNNVYAVNLTQFNDYPDYNAKYLPVNNGLPITAVSVVDSREIGLSTQSATYTPPVVPPVSTPYNVSIHTSYAERSGLCSNGAPYHTSTGAFTGAVYSRTVGYYDENNNLITVGTASTNTEYRGMYSGAYQSVVADCVPAEPVGFPLLNGGYGANGSVFFGGSEAYTNYLNQATEAGLALSKSLFMASLQPPKYHDCWIYFGNKNNGIATATGFELMNGDFVFKPIFNGFSGSPLTMSETNGYGTATAFMLPAIAKNKKFRYDLKSVDDAVTTVSLDERVSITGDNILVLFSPTRNASGETTRTKKFYTGKDNFGITVNVESGVHDVYGKLYNDDTEGSSLEKVVIYLMVDFYDKGTALFKINKPVSYASHKFKATINVFNFDNVTGWSTVFKVEEFEWS